MKIVIPINPRSKKNSQEICFNKKTGKRFIKQSELYKTFEKECGKYMPNLKQLKPYITKPSNLSCKFYVCDARKRDIANYIEAIQDILVKYQIISDDNYNVIASLDGCSMEIDRKNPRVEIEIERVDKNASS